MEKNICHLCGKEFIYNQWYKTCENCQILCPNTKMHILKEIETILVLRENLSDHLHKLEQKRISVPDTITMKEKEEYNIWTTHNNLYDEIMMFIDLYDTRKEIRFKEIYPRLYSYVKISDRIKAIYK